MQKFDLSKRNPFASYNSNFGAYFSFGPAFDDWVCETILDAVLPKRRAASDSVRLADIGAGSCYWARLFLTARADIAITAVDPSASLILEQAARDIAADGASQLRLSRRCMTAQDFATECRGPEQDGPYDCIYFMQSAHYVGDAEFENVFAGLAQGLKQDSGKIVIQARNMTQASDTYGRNASPSAVSVMLRPSRRKRLVPSHFSNAAMPWLTALGVTFSSAAALRKLLCRAAASKILNDASGGKCSGNAGPPA